MQSRSNSAAGTWMLNVLIIFSISFIGLTSCFEEEYVKKIYKWSLGLDKWTPTNELMEDTPMYHSGYDYEGRPVLVIELGQWKVDKYIAGKNPAKEALLMRRVEKTMYAVLTSEKYNNDTENGFALIVDGTGLAIAKIRDHKFVQFHLKAILLLEALMEYISDIYLVNVNTAFEVMLHAVRPLAPKLFSRVELIGTNKEKVISNLRRLIPKDQLTPRYGGNENFKPISIL